MNTTDQPEATDYPANPSRRSAAPNLDSTIDNHTTKADWSCAQNRTAEPERWEYQTWQDAAMNLEMIDILTTSLGVYGSAPMSYLSLLARDAITKPSDLDSVLDKVRTAASIRAMRYSVHIFPLDLLPVMAAATRKNNQAAVTNRAKKLGDQLSKTSPRVIGALASGPLTASNIKAIADPNDTTGPLFALVLATLATEHTIVRVPATGGWRSNRLRYALWSEWLPTTDPFALSETDARRELAARYANAYGPVTISDLAWWTGWTIADANTAADGIDLSVSGGAASLLSGIRLLPAWDVHMVAHKGRSHIIDERHLHFAYDAMGNATSVVTQDGRVVGIWDLGKQDKPLHIRVAPLTTWSTSMWDAVALQVDKIRLFLDQPTVTIERRSDPVDLTTVKKNQHLYPLSD